jgi:hypothetical protein
MPDDLRQRYARLENEQGQLWDIVDQVHLGPVSPDKDLVEAVADTIKQVAEAWRERAEKAEAALARLHTYATHRRGCAADGAGQACTCGLAALDLPESR